MRLVAVLCFLFFTACSPTPQDTAPMSASPEREALLQTVDQFFLTLGAGDADAFQALHSEAAVNVIVQPGSGEVVSYRTIADFVEGMRSDQFPKIRERYWDPVVLERSGLAVVWAPYSIDIDDERAHCGVDVFNLSKHGQRWKIDSVSFTIEPSACDEISPGTKAVVQPDFSVLDAKEN